MSNSTKFSWSRLICIINSSLWTGSLFGKKVKISRQGKEGELVDEALRLLFCPLVMSYQNLSARSLSVAWIYWNGINFMHECKKGVGRQHTTFTSCQNASSSNEFFLWKVDYALEKSTLWQGKFDFCRLFHTERMWHAYWFSAVIVSCWHDLPSDARAFSLTSFET